MVLVFCHYVLVDGKTPRYEEPRAKRKYDEFRIIRKGKSKTFRGTEQITLGTQISCKEEETGMFSEFFRKNIEKKHPD